MRRLLIITASLAAAVAIAGTSSASAQGLNAGLLQARGWDCPFVLGAIHCAPPGGLARVGSGEALMMIFLVFDVTNGKFLGTEVIVRADVFSGQPCPTDPPSGQYTYLNAPPHDIDLDYYACHHYDSPF
jgi:hypothetical protein